MERVFFEDLNTGKTIQGNLFSMVLNGALHTSSSLQLAISSKEPYLLIGKDKVFLDNEGDDNFSLNVGDKRIVCKKIKKNNRFYLISAESNEPVKAGVLRLTVSDSGEFIFVEKNNITFFRSFSDQYHRDFLMIFWGEDSGCKIFHNKNNISVKYNANKNYFSLQQ